MGINPEDERQKLTLQTSPESLNGFPRVSMLPTPLIGSNAQWELSDSPNTPGSVEPLKATTPTANSHNDLLSDGLNRASHTASTAAYHQSVRSPGGGASLRNVSTSIVPDTPSLHSNLASAVRIPSAGTHIVPGNGALNRADSLVVPKRRGLPFQIGRSLSVGGPQRLPSTVLHREPKVDTIPETLPEDVYVATDNNGKHTAWTRVKIAGKGSFSEVVLARPAIEFVKPEIAQQVEDQVENELILLGDTMDSTHHPRTHSMLVAVKVTTLNHSRSDSQIELFKRDLEIMSQLPHHPSLMRLIGWSIDKDIHQRALFILPYCAGGDLFDLVSRHRSRMSCMLVRRLFADVCSAIVFLHSHDVVHRDIKLENVLIDIRVAELLALPDPSKFDGPLAVVTDLGLARKIDPQNPMLTTRCGSDDYVPPEIMMGQPYDGRETDSWALGVLLYAMMEGRLPFDAPPHIAQHEGNRARLKTAHRIARVDWTWYKRANSEDEWKEGKEVVEGCLKRRANRRLASETLKLPWVKDAIRPEIHESHDAEDEISEIFVQ